MKNIRFDKLIDLALFLYIFSLYLFTYRAGLFVISNALSFVFVSLVALKVLILNKRIIMNKYLWIHLMFIFISLASYFYANNQEYVLEEVRTLALIYLVMIALVNYVDSQNKLKNVMNYFILSGTIASIYILFVSDFSQLSRLGGEIGNSNAVGMMIVISSVFGISRFITCKNKIILLELIPMITVVILTGSRKSFLFLLMSILLILYTNNKENLKGKLKFFALSIGMLFFAFYIITEVSIFREILGDRFKGLFAFVSGDGKIDSSILVRRHMIDFGLQLFKERPFWGYGLKNYRVLYGLTHGVERYSHNNFVELLVNVGLTGTVVFYYSNYVIVKSLYQRVINRNNSAIIYSFIAVIIGYFILGTSLVYYYNKHISMVLAIASAIPNVCTVDS